MSKLFSGDLELTMAAAKAQGYTLVDQQEHAGCFLGMWTNRKPLQRDRFAFINPEVPSDANSKKLMELRTGHAIIYEGTATGRAYWDRLVRKCGWRYEALNNPTPRELQNMLSAGLSGVIFSPRAAALYVELAGPSLHRAFSECKKARALGWNRVETYEVPKLVLGQAGDVLGQMVKVAFGPGSHQKLARLVINMPKEQAYPALILLEKLWGGRSPVQALFVAELKLAADELRITYEAAVRLAVLSGGLLHRPQLLLEAQCRD